MEIYDGSNIGNFDWVFLIDATLKNFSLLGEEKSISMTFSKREMEYLLIFHQVESFRADSISDVNVIDRLNIYSCEAESRQSRSLLCYLLSGVECDNMDPGDEPFIQAKLERIKKAEVVLVEVEPAVGGEFIVLCKSVEIVRPGQAGSDELKLGPKRRGTRTTR